MFSMFFMVAMALLGLEGPPEEVPVAGAAAEPAPVTRFAYVEACGGMTRLSR